MIELFAAAALTPWTHPLAFRPLPGWRTGASGNVPSLYGPSLVRAPKASSAWIARNVRYRDRATDDPPNKTLQDLPSRGVIVWAVIFSVQLHAAQAHQARSKQGKASPMLRGRLRRGRSVRVNGIRPTSRLLSDRPRLFRIAANESAPRRGTAGSWPFGATTTPLATPAARSDDSTLGDIAAHSPRERFCARIRLSPLFIVAVCLVSPRLRTGALCAPYDCARSPTRPKRSR